MQGLEGMLGRAAPDSEEEEEDSEVSAQDRQKFMQSLQSPDRGSIRTKNLAKGFGRMRAKAKDLMQARAAGAASGGPAGQPAPAQGAPKGSDAELGRGGRLARDMTSMFAGMKKPANQWQCGTFTFAVQSHGPQPVLRQAHWSMKHLILVCINVCIRPLVNCTMCCHVLLHSMIVHVLFSTVVQGVLLPPVRKAAQHIEISTLSEPLKLSQFQSVHETCWKQTEQQCCHADIVWRRGGVQQQIGMWIYRTGYNPCAESIACREYATLRPISPLRFA